MNQVDYLQQLDTGSLTLEEKLEIKPLGVHQPQDVVRNQTTELPADVKQLLVIKEEILPELSPGLEEQNLELLHIKEEQEEVRASQEGEYLHGLEEADITRFPFTVVHVKSEDDDEKPQASQVHRSQPEDNRKTEPPTNSSDKEMQTESDEAGCGGPALARNTDPNLHVQSNNDENFSDSSGTEVSDAPDGDWQAPVSDSGPETEHSDSGWTETMVAESGVNTLKNKRTHPSGRRSSSCLHKNKCFRLMSNVDSQMEIQTDEKVFRCGVCGQRFTQKHNLQTHMRVHTGEKPFHCDVCGKRFRHHYSFKAHCRIHTGEKAFICGICGERFTQQQNLKRHMRVHTSEKPFSCGVCGKRFAQGVVLKRHMRVHSQEKPFACDVCGNRYNLKTNLKKHMIIHTGERPFSCDMCGKRFRRKEHLKMHTSSHMGEKPFGCSVCGKTFNRKTHLKTHMIVHTGEKPHGCELCGNKFVHHHDLKVHMRVHTGEKPFCCEVCGKTFTQQGSLNRHSRIHPE